MQYTTVADPKLLNRGGGGRQFISLIVKCTQRTVCLLHGKTQLFEKNSEPIGGRPPSPLFESATGTQIYRNSCVEDRQSGLNNRVQHTSRGVSSAVK